LNAVTDLRTTVPDELVEEFLKRLPYVSEGISNPRLLPGNTQVAIELRPGYEDKSEVLSSWISEVAVKLCSNHRAGTSKTLAKREVFPSSFDGAPVKWRKCSGLKPEPFPR
jgi:hypothetical protein